MPRTHGPAHPLHLDVIPDGGYVGSVLGVPVAVRASTLGLFVLLGWLFDGHPGRVAHWVLAGALVLLLMQVAHGVAARAAGLAPTVELSWLGGLTRWHRPTASTPRALAVLFVAPLTGALLAGAAIAGRTVVAAGGREDALSAIATETLDVLLLVAIGAAAIELLPVVSRNAGRVLHQLLSGSDVARTIRVATVGTATCATATALLAVSSQPRLAVLPGFYLLTNGWIAVRGDRTIGRTIEQALVHGDWRTVRRRVLHGCDDATQVADAQQHFLDRSQFEAAAEIGDAALERWPLPGFALRTARARVLLEQPDLAVTRLRDAVRFGADPDALAEQPMFRPLTTSSRWPRRADELADVIQLPAPTGAMRFSAVAS